MAKIVKCKNNHFYDADEYKQCPYCFPDTVKLDDSENPETTTINNPVPPKQEENANKTFIPQKKFNQGNDEINLDKTFIPGIESDTGNIDSHEKFTQRKIVGWIISFDMNPYGLDFRIYEGRNTIGRKPGNDITINEVSVSSEHAFILTRANRIFLSDKQSANGTTINGEIVFPDQSKELNDGDEIVFGKGNAKFIFRTAIKI